MSSVEDPILKNLQAFIGFARKRVGDAHLAEDVVQDSLVKALTADRKPAGEEDTVAWFYRILRRSIIDLYRRHDARSRALDRLRSRNTRSQREEPLEGDHPGVITCHFEARHMVRNALKHLSHEQRTVIEMAFFNGMSHAELAKALNLPLGTVKTRIRLGMMKLRDLLQGS